MAKWVIQSNLSDCQSSEHQSKLYLSPFTHSHKHLHAYQISLKLINIKGVKCEHKYMKDIFVNKLRNYEKWTLCIDKRGKSTWCIIDLDKKYPSAFWLWFDLIDYLNHWLDSDQQTWKDWQRKDCILSEFGKCLEQSSNSCWLMRRSASNE